MNEIANDQVEMRKRLIRVLDSLAERGTTQQTISQTVGVPAQYLSDVKNARKPLSELFARRLAECYGFDYHWLMMQGGDPPSFLEGAGHETTPGRTSVQLRAFDRPIYGEPRSHPEWDGTLVDVSGAASAQAQAAKDPYILRFRKTDTQGVLRRNDLILVSQGVNPHAEIEVVREGKLCFLARRSKDGTWRRIANNQPLRAQAHPVGYCVGLVWRVL
jgi:hypothetical protein